MSKTFTSEIKLSIRYRSRFWRAPRSPVFCLVCKEKFRVNEKIQNCFRIIQHLLVEYIKFSANEE